MIVASSATIMPAKEMPPIAKALSRVELTP